MRGQLKHVCFFKKKPEVTAASSGRRVGAVTVAFTAVHFLSSFFLHTSPVSCRSCTVPPSLNTAPVGTIPVLVLLESPDRNEQASTHLTVEIVILL